MISTTSVDIGIPNQPIYYVRNRGGTGEGEREREGEGGRGREREGEGGRRKVRQRRFERGYTCFMLDTLRWHVGTISCH